MGPGLEHGMDGMNGSEWHELRKYCSLNVFFSLMFITLRVSSCQQGLVATAWTVHDGWQSLFTMPWR